MHFYVQIKSEELNFYEGVDIASHKHWPVLIMIREKIPHMKKKQFVY